MANDIKTKIQLDGEKEYSAALKEANRNLRTLKTELKAETAEMGKNAMETEKAAKKQESLKKQIREQEKIVKTYTEALAEVKEKYGDNEDEIAKWQQRLNNARATLGDMRSALAETGDALGNVGKNMQSVEQNSSTAVTATRSLAESLGSLADIGGSLADGIGNAFTGMVDIAKNSIATIWSDIVDIAAKSNNKVDLAGYWNTDVETIEKYAGAARDASADLQDLNDLVTKINNKATTMKREDWLQLIPVSPENYTDQWQFAMDVMEQLNSMDVLERNAAGFEIFGRGATKMFDMANDWQTVLDSLAKYDASNGGYGLTGEELQTMSELYDKVNGLEESWNRLKAMGEVKLFGSLAMDLTSNAQGILDGFLHYFNAENDAERDSAIGEIEGNITEAFERARNAIEGGVALLDQVAEDLKNSENPTAQALGNIVGGLVDALQWLTEDNMSNCVKALEVFAGFWIAGKGMQMASTIAEMAANIKTVQLFGMLNKGTTGASSAAGAAGEAVKATVGSKIVNGLGNTVVGKALGNLATVGVGDIIGAGTMGVMALGDKTRAGQTLQNGGTIGEAVEAGKEEIADWADQVSKNAEEWLETARGVWDNAARFWNQIYYGNPEGPGDGTGGIAQGIGNINSDILSLGNRAGGDVEYDENGEALTSIADEGIAIVAALDSVSELQETAEKILDEIYEFEDLDSGTTLEDKDNAMQYWWDMWKMAQQGQASDEEESEAYDQMMEAWGDDFAEAINAIWEHVDQMTEGEKFSLEDIPQSWWQNAGGDSDQLTSSDIAGFRSLPEMMRAAVAQGASSGVSGIRVEIDGYSAGRILAPYVSQEIARFMRT